jgi:hypothetical protein
MRSRTLCISLHINQCANCFIITPLQQNMSTGVIIIFLDSHRHNACHPGIDSQGLPYTSPSLPRALHSLRSHRPAKAEKVKCAGFVNDWGSRMEEARSVEVLEVIVCACGVVYEDRKKCQEPFPVRGTSRATRDSHHNVGRLRALPRIFELRPHRAGATQRTPIL